MKTLITISALLLSTATFADHHKGKMSFEDKKAHALESIKMRMSHMEKKKACVEGAADKEALKKCHKDMKAEGKEMRKMMKDKRKEMRKKKDS